jgi:hypothetical protein
MRIYYLLQSVNLPAGWDTNQVIWHLAQFEDSEQKQVSFATGRTRYRNIAGVVRVDLRAMQWIEYRRCTSRLDEACGR